MPFGDLCGFVGSGRRTGQDEERRGWSVKLGTWSRIKRCFFWEDPRTVVGLAELLEGDARLCPAIECFHVRLGEAEDGRAVALGVFIPTVISRCMWREIVGK